jgi:hypothetical protein
MRTIIQLSLLIFVLIAWGCGQGANSSLFISANPTSPYLIPQSTPVNDNPNVVTPIAPYFTMNSITISWTGSSQFQLLSLALYAANLGSAATTAGAAFNCGGGGSAISDLFSTSTFFDFPVNCSGVNGNSVIDVNQNLTIPGIPAGAAAGCVVSARSAAFYCDSVPVAISNNPFATYNIPVQIIVFGETLDSNGNTTGRVNGIGNINVQ